MGTVNENMPSRMIEIREIFTTMKIESDAILLQKEMDIHRVAM